MKTAKSPANSSTHWPNRPAAKSSARSGKKSSKALTNASPANCTRSTVWRTRPTCRNTMASSGRSTLRSGAKGRWRRHAAAITTNDRISAARGADPGEREMNTNPIATGGSTALLALLLFCAAPATRAQDARLQLDRLDRLAANATESVEITMNDVQVQFLKKLVSLSESDRSKLKVLLS